MATNSAMYASSRRRQSPLLEAFLAPQRTFLLPTRNSRSLIRKLQVFTVLFQHLAEDSSLGHTEILCFKELYLLHHSKFLLRYCSHSSKIWLLLQSPSLSSFFHDVLPVDSLCLSHDVREQVKLLHKHSSSKLFVDDNDETLCNRLYTFLNEFENASVPNSEELSFFFVEKLGIKDPISYKSETEFLEEQIKSHGCDLEPTRSVINGFIDITRYVMFLLFKIQDGDEWSVDNMKKQRKGLISEEIENTVTTLPKDFTCSISLSLMNDPVIVSTGQTYERSSIAR
ncbi:unnamed protein product [Eruca vesicaria subsp. sativa]|uniref:U-box domain-containing protein n=1 Tax=Eruca vesicaria subsp. sativa TaxID=29727 RepID=A0ABC8J5U5_ERUVS|nr:unnamed protein product [Eruca vesicaria subsp. sativa]